MTLFSYLKQVGQIILDLIYPPSCVNCGEAGACFCDACIAAVARFPEPRCIRCDLPLLSYPVTLCEDCERGGMIYLEGLRVIGPHQEPLREAIHLLKYESHQGVARRLGWLLATCWQERATITIDGLLPVPLHPDRQRERGFNQCALLAEAMSIHLAIPMNEGLLTRIRDTRSQVGLSQGERLQNVAGAFVASPEVAGKCWLLVDDVCTTGSTLMACAQALHAQGARAVWAITLTRPFYGKAKKGSVAQMAPIGDKTIWEWDNQAIWQ